MRRRWYYIWGTLLAGCVIAAIAFWPSKEPSYQGRSLTQWLDARLTTEINGMEFDTAILQMGTNALPKLVYYISYEPKPLLNSIAKYLEKHFPNSSIATRVRARIAHPEYRQWAATDAFRVLGPSAESAVPRLARCLNRSKSSYAATKALIHIGEKAYPPLVAALTNEWVVYGVQHGISWGYYPPNIFTNALLTIPALIQNLQSPNTKVAKASLATLVSIQNWTNLPRAELISLWTKWHSNDLAERLIQTLKSDNTEFAICSALALSKVHPRSELIRHALQDALEDPRPQVRAVVIDVLAEFDRAGLPTLRQASNDPAPSIRGHASNLVEKIEARRSPESP
jgi:hypothetical protein